MTKIIHNSDFSASIVETVNVSALVTFEKQPRSLTALPKDEGSGKIAIWGEENDFPQKVIEDVRKDAELGPLLEKQAVLLYSGGLTWGIPSLNEKGEEILTPLKDNEHLEILSWMRTSNISRYLFEASVDLFWFFNAFPEIILSLDRKKIVQLCVQQAERCRWEKMDKSGYSKNCYISANFPEAKETDALTKKLPVIDPYYNPAENLRAMPSGTNFIYPLSFPTPGSTYYQLASWNGLRESGWLAVSQAIPKFKLNLLEKQLNIKYHVEISDQYWPMRYKNWESLSDKDKQAKVEAELSKFADIMKGVEGSGNSLVTAMRTDFNLNKEFSMWKITVIDNKLAKGEFMEEVKEASLNKSMAIGLHPALVGTVANDGLGGAGSNIREAYNLHNIMNRPKQDILLEPLYLIRDFNGWNPLLEFRIKNPFMTTLDAGAETANSKPKA